MSRAMAMSIIFWRVFPKRNSAMTMMTAITETVTRNILWPAAMPKAAPGFCLLTNCSKPGIIEY